MARGGREAAFFTRFAAVFTRRLSCAVLRRAAVFEREMAARARAAADLRPHLRFGLAPRPIMSLSLSTVSSKADLAFEVIVFAFKVDLRN